MFLLKVNMSAVKKRTIAQPIFEANDDIVVVTNPLPTPAPIDIVINHTEEPFEEITLNVQGDKDTINDESGFWAFISSLRWADIVNRQSNSEISKRGHKLVSELNEVSFATFLEYFNDYKKELFDEFVNHEIFEKLERELTGDERTYLLSHIIFRGKSFYENILADPIFAGYLVGKTAAADEFYHNTITRKVSDKKGKK